MNMTCSRLALRLLARADAGGTHEALIGDLLEEIAHGRSQVWLCQQLIGLYGVAIATHARTRARLTPSMVALALAVALVAGFSIASVNNVVETWLGFYLVSGTLSLFAHMASRTNDSRRSVIPAEAEESIAG
jgi:hypothetical protein